MNGLENIFVSEIIDIFNVFSPKGREELMTDRKCFGLSFCKSGQITYTLDGKSYISDNCHAIILPKGKTYSIHGDRTGDFTVINFLCDKRFMSDSFISIKISSNERYIKDFEAMKELSLLPHSNLKIMEIFYRILNRLNSETHQQSGAITEITSYIEKNYSNQQLSNVLIAEEAGLSEVYMRQLISRHLHTSPKQYILDLRLQKAKQLLSDSRMKINNIAISCGFTTVQHFCRAFKQATSKTPTEYRNENTKKALQN